MKKLLIFSLCLLGICNARAEMMTAQEIILNEVSYIQPWDSKDEEKQINPTGGKTRFDVLVDGKDLYIVTDSNEAAYAEIINQEDGELVAEEEFVGETTMNIPDEGDYVLYIYTESGSVLAGEFAVE